MPFLPEAGSMYDIIGIGAITCKNANFIVRIAKSNAYEINHEHTAMATIVPIKIL